MRDDERMRVPHTANMIRSLGTALLVLATLVAFAGPGWARAFAPVDTLRSFPAALVDTVSAEELEAVVPTFLTAADGTDRPCNRRDASTGTARCPTAVPCLTVCGGLPNAAFAVPPPSVGADSYARVVSDPSRGITTLPDLPPPRLSA
ncbi:hypothetical protein [Azospirillum rugosum]|uniref:Uncharacterized protein n=2 Tax=Azospirillum brasilense TaxID=192 RepID=A0A6L3B1Q7_AZOBR|nr:hypothetical protein DS837_11185 [Azospirillum brasilense]